MERLIKVLSFFVFFYFVISWATYNPVGAKKFKTDVDEFFKDTVKVVSDYINSLDDIEEGND